jgi:hypothetical protein
VTKKVVGVFVRFHAPLQLLLFCEITQESILPLTPSDENSFDVLLLNEYR